MSVVKPPRTLPKSRQRPMVAKRPLILGASDPVGMAHEAAYLRLALPSKAVKWLMAQRDGARRLQTAVTLVGDQPE